MSLIDRLLNAIRTWTSRRGRARTNSHRPDRGVGAAAVVRQPVPEPFIEAYDAFGRKVLVPRDEWRSQILLPRLAQSWNAPDVLYSNIVSGLRNGFEGDVLEAAKHLARTYPERDEYANLLGCLLIQLGCLDEAEEAFDQFLSLNSPSGYVLANLARVYDIQGKAWLVDQTLWKAIETDPNQKLSLQWLLERAKEQGGDRAQRSVLVRAASHPGSWRARLVIAHAALIAGNPNQAMPVYESLISTNPDNPELLATLCDQLVAHDDIDEMLRLVSPVYKPQRHGPGPGLHLLQAYLSKQDIDAGQKLLHEMFELSLPSYQERLMQLAQAFDDLSKSANPPPQPAEPLAMDLVLIDQPIWAPALSSPSWLLPEKAPSAASIAIVAFSNLQPATDRHGLEAEDIPGRLSRAIPLYLMESLCLRTSAMPWFVLPVIDQLGPAVSTTEWSQDMLADMFSHVDQRPEFVISGSIQAEPEGCRLSASLWSFQGMALLETITQGAPLNRVGDAVSRIERDIITFLELSHDFPRSEYALSEDRLAPDALSRYIDCEGQSLALLLAQRGVCPISTLWGERVLIGSALSLSLEEPSAHAPQLLFLANLLLDRDAGSNIYTEFSNSAINFVQQTEAGSPLYNVSPMLYRLFGYDGDAERRKQELGRTAHGDFARWLEHV